MKNSLKVTTTYLFILFGLVTQAQEENIKEKENFFNQNIEYHAKIQFSLGGAAPLGIPAQIRKIESFKPSSFFGVEVNATKWFNENHKLGIRTGLRFEGRGMKTEAEVKNYYTQIQDDSGAETKGYFTGQVVTEVKNTYLTLPVLLTWNASERWSIYGGFYFSTIVNKSFNGYIFEGVFREGSPIGEPASFEGTAIGVYNFSDDLSHFQWGNQLGVEYKIHKKIIISLDVTMSHKQLFRKDFEAISFKMYNIYGNLGFAYKL